MIEKKYFDRDDVSLRRMYEEGKINSKEFLELLFSSKEADRTRRKIVKKNESNKEVLVKA